MSDGYPRNRLTAAFERRVASALEGCVPHHAPLVVACSAGPDSTAALIAVARVHDGPLTAACFDHGMRAALETASDRAAVDEVAGRLGASCAWGAADSLGAGASEADARHARYRWLSAACHEAGARHCATGHTLDDQAETVLLHLVRGAGLAGATGMAPDAPWPVVEDSGALRLVRPLLGIRRLEVLAYLDALGVEPRIDTTNELVTFHRNRVRHRVVPELRSINPRVDDALVRFAALARRDDDALEAWARREAAGIVTVEDGAAVSTRAALRALPPAVASRVLRQAAALMGLQLDGEQIEAMLRLAGRRGSALSLAGGQFIVEDERVVIRRHDAAGGVD